MSYAIINSSLAVVTDLSMNVAGSWRSAVLGSAHGGNAQSFNPTSVVIEADHLAALQALGTSDYRALRLLGFQVLDLGALQADGTYAITQRQALAAALVGAPWASKRLAGIGQ